MTLNTLKIQLTNQVLGLKNNLYILLYLLLRIILFFLVLAFYASIRVLWVPIQENQPVSGANKAISLRIDDYELSVKRIKSGINYLPPAPLFQNPFKNK
jgi:hypothetical protein